MSFAENSYPTVCAGDLEGLLHWPHRITRGHRGAQMDCFHIPQGKIHCNSGHISVSCMPRHRQMRSRRNWNSGVLCFFVFPDSTGSPQTEKVSAWWQRTGNRSLSQVFPPDEHSNMTVITVITFSIGTKENIGHLTAEGCGFNSNVGLSVWSLHILALHLSALSWCSSFPQSREMQYSFTCNCRLSVYMSVNS